MRAFLLLLGMVLAVFVAAWAVFGTVAWGVGMAAMALLGGAVIGASTDPD